MLLDVLTGIKGIADVSATFVTWSLTVIGASVLTIVSTSYLRPVKKGIRYAYFLFLPGWICLALSLNAGNAIARRLAAGYFANDAKILLQIGNNVNKEFAEQISFFKAGLVFFTLWLMVYLLWWIFGDWKLKDETY